MVNRMNEATRLRETHESAELVKSMVLYDADTGIFRWRISFNSRHEGQTAGYIKRDGYLYLKVMYVEYFAHRIAWLLITGEWPPQTIDHINMDRADCRFSNLRQASTAQNNKNRTKQANNTSGYKGVSLVKASGKYQAKIMHSGKNIHIGLFIDPAEAGAAYALMAEKLHGEFSRTENACLDAVEELNKC